MVDGRPSAVVAGGGIRARPKQQDQSLRCRGWTNGRGSCDRCGIAAALGRSVDVGPGLDQQREHVDMVALSGLEQGVHFS